MAFDANRYSVPRPWAFRAVTVKGYVDRVVVVAGGQVVAEHPRCYGHSQQVLDPLHYLATLERRPAALDHAPVYRDWQPPAALAGLRRELEAKHGLPGGTRQYIRVLQLLGRAPAVADRAGDRGVPRRARRLGRGDRPADPGAGGRRGRADIRDRSFM